MLSVSLPSTSVRVADALILAAGSYVLYNFFQTVRQRAKTTKLSGPPSNSWLLGRSTATFQGDAAALYEEWAKEHGTVFSVPGTFGSRRIVITDPKDVSHFYANETYTYLQSDIAKRCIESLVRSSAV